MQGPGIHLSYTEGASCRVTCPPQSTCVWKVGSVWAGGRGGGFSAGGAASWGKRAGKRGHDSTENALPLFGLIDSF